jgi:hypothetical protein
MYPSVQMAWDSFPFRKQNKVMNNFPLHISFHQLADYVEGRLPLTQRMQFEAHFAQCSSCSTQVARLEHLIGLMRTDRSEDAPPTVVARVKKLFPSRPLPESTSSDLRRCIVAVLHFDSLGLTRAFGVRSGKPAARQLLFSAGVDEIDLRIEQTGDTWTISGQILGETAAGGKVLLYGEADTLRAKLNELSEFLLSPVEAGTYKLIVSLENVDVEIDELKIGA